MSSASPPLVLTFAASDPTGGAGVQADLLTLAALGCHPLSVLTALTVQDTRGVESLEPVAADLVARQAESLLAESEVAAFKVGVLGSAANARAVAAIVAPATMSQGMMSRIVFAPAGMKRWPLMPAKASGAEVVKPSFHPGKG